MEFKVRKRIQRKPRLLIISTAMARNVSYHRLPIVTLQIIRTPPPPLLLVHGNSINYKVIARNAQSVVSSPVGHRMAPPGLFSLSRPEFNIVTKSVKYNLLILLVHGFLGRLYPSTTTGCNSWLTTTFYYSSCPNRRITFAVLLFFATITVVG